MTRQYGAELPAERTPATIAREEREDFVATRIRAGHKDTATQ